MNKVKSQTRLANTAQVFSSLVEMRFKPNNQSASETLAKRKEKMEKSKKEMVEIYDPTSMVLQADRKIENSQSRRLKFLVSLSSQHFLVGNQNQIDMIGFGAIAHSFVQTDFYWSLSLKGPIESVVVQPKRSIFVILSECTLYFYRYSTKTREQPELIITLGVKESVRFIRFLKDILLGVFYNSSYQFYNIENLGLIKKKLQKNYPIDAGKKLLTIPPSIENIINVFFEEAKDKKQSFILWCLEINFGTEQIKTRQLYRFYDIMNYVKGKLSIQNYTKEIIFMNLDHQIMAIKNGYLIDTVNVSVKGEGEFLKYIHPETILHITKKHVQVYNFSINMAVKPQKIILRSLDSIEIQRYPQNAFYISVLKTTNNNFAIFFQDSDKKSRQTKGQISYYFEVSQTTTLKAKIKSIFDSIGYGQSNPEIIEEKYNMALKMGLTEKQIYLQIWSRSNRSSLQNYQYILATRDYKIIKSEIQKKLKKESMNLREILKIQESCHEINRQKIENPSCCQQDLQDFVSSHFLLKKLKLYKEIHVLDRFSSIVNLPEEAVPEGDSKQLKIDIQQYYYFKNLDVKAYILDQINEMLINFKNNAKVIRMTLKDFKFVYRLIYPQILEEMIVSAKDNLINLLNEIPELMPYIHKDLNDQQRKQGLYGGIWGEVEPNEWQRCLYPEAIENIHNKSAVNEFVNSVWFKRYWLTGHGMTGKSKKEILKINQYNNSQKIFYFFIAKLYDCCKSNKPFYYQTVNFLQEKYQMFPAHLKNKIVLYENLYTYYFNQEKGNTNRLSLTEFLQWDDQNLFKYFFDHEKTKKNSLLREIKPIYQQSDVNGSHIFNIGLFSYFYSDISQISDLKFILNRINNEKTEFHKKNHGIYQVLVRSMQLKLRIGSANDIPIDQVMVYIENIPVDREQQIMQELSVMQNIKSEVTIFKKMKIDMTVKDIMDQFEVVVEKLLKYFIEQNNVLQLRNYEQFRQKSIEILKQTERIKNKIYSVQNSTYTLLVYLSLIMRNDDCILKVASLLEDGQIHHLFEVEEKTIQNIVFYMFKWKFSQSAKYIDNAEYIRKLLDLLPTENECRNYLNTQLELGLILSSPTNPFLYPLSENSHCPGINTIHEVFKGQSQKYLLQLNLERLYELVSRMQKFVNGEAKKSVETISLHKLYQIMIVELLQKELYREVIDYLRKILHLESNIKNQGIIYIGLYIYKLAKEFNQESKKCIFKLLALYFKQPEALLKILEFIIKTRLTGLQQTKYLRQILETQTQTRYNFNNHNSILSKEFTSQYQHANSKKVVQVYRDYLKSKNQQFEQGSEYDIIFTMLCHSPYLLLKFLQLEKEHLRFKEISMFIHMAVNRPIFNQKKAYEVLKRIFTALIINSKQSKDIDLLLIGFQSKSTEDQFQVPKFNKLNEQQTKIFKIVRSFTKAEKKLKRKQTISKEDRKERRILHIRSVMDNPATIFHDKFDVEESDSQIIVVEEKEFTKKTKPLRINFNDAKEKTTLFFRKQTFGQFLQSYGIQRTQLSQVQLIKRQSAPTLQINKLSESVKSKKALRNQMIERLHSHRVVIGSEYQDDPQSRKQDEQFLDYFLPKRGINQSRSSVGSVRSSRGRAIPEEISTINKNIEKIMNDQPQSNTNLADQEFFQLVQTNKSQELSEIDRFELLKEQLVKNYNQTKIPRFDLTPLEPHIQNLQSQNDKDTTQQVEAFLRNFFKYLYSQNLQTLSINLKLIQDIARKHPAAGVNNFFLQAYQRIFATHQKHGLEMNIAELLPLSGVYIKSKDIVDLYHEIQPLIVAKITDENVFKLSKLIALGFRKTVVEQEILFNYFRGLAKTYLQTSVEELGALTQKLKSILHKLQVQVLIDKGEQLFRELPEGERRDQLLTSYTEALKNKGYQSAARELLNKLA